jgi:hypothetical protein
MYFAHVNKKGIELVFSHHYYQGDFLVVIENNYVMKKIFLSQVFCCDYQEP